MKKLDIRIRMTAQQSAESHNGCPMCCGKKMRRGYPDYPCQHYGNGGKVESDPMMETADARSAMYDHATRDYNGSPMGVR
jgi:hypothetical protein